VKDLVYQKDRLSLQENEILRHFVPQNDVKAEFILILRFARDDVKLRVLSIPYLNPSNLD